MVEVTIMQTEWERLRESIHATSQRLINSYHPSRGLVGDLVKQSPAIRVPLTLAVLGVSV